MDPWLIDQRDTPSISMGLFADRVNSILEGPLPKCLRLKGETDDVQKSINISGWSAKGNVSSPFRNSGNSKVYSYYNIRKQTPQHQHHEHGKPIHEVLLDKGRITAEHKETMRQKALEKELSELRPAPNITYAAIKNTPRKDKPIEDRLLLRAKEAEKRREFEAKRHEEEIKKEMSIIAPFHPNISLKGRKATPKARKMAEETRDDWYRRREQRREAARTAKILEDLSEVQGTPIINPRSEKLAARRKEREGFSGISTVEALIERDRISQLKRWEKHEMERRSEATPQITLYAATLQRNGDAAERLYAESYEKEERRLRREKGEIYNNISSFTPKISPQAIITPRFRSVEDELMQKHMQSMVQKEETRRREEEQELMRHQPAINPVSEAIAAKLPETTFERLYRHSQNKSRYLESTMVEKYFNESNNNNNNSGTYRISSLPESMSEALQSYEEHRLEKLKSLREEQERIQNKECTFTPVTNGEKRIINGGPNKVAERNQQWLVRKEQKLQELRQRKANDNAKDCTFKPERETTIDNSFRGGGGAGGDSVYGGDGTPWGVQEYLERQEEARRLRREREARLHRRPSSAPRVSITTPQEFLLGRRGSMPVRSLQRPPHIRLMSPEKEENSTSTTTMTTTTITPASSSLLFMEGKGKEYEDDLSVYERIYNRIYNNAFINNKDDVESSLCVPPSLYS